MIRHILLIINVLLFIAIVLNILKIFLNRNSRSFRLVKKETIVTTIVLFLILVTCITLRHTVFVKKEEIKIVEKEAIVTSKKEKIVTSSYYDMDYYTYLPKGYKENMPLVVYLHGDDYVKDKDLKTGGLYYFVKNIYGGKYPFVLIQPHTNEKSWSKKYILFKLKGLIDYVKEKYQTNPYKVILIGHSRGAMGSWEYANYFFNDLSCMIPISGQDNGIFPFSYLNLPIRAYSTKDKSDSWNHNKMKKTIKEITEFGGKDAKFTSIKGYTHANIMYKVITKKLFDWALSK